MHFLSEAMKSSGRSECEIPVLGNTTYRRDGLGSGNFYNGNNYQPLTFKDLVSRATATQIVHSMRSQAEILRASAEYAGI